MGKEEKRSVIQRLDDADRWFQIHGVPCAWIRELLQDARMQLQSESGALWMQTMTGREGHVRLFVHGPFGAREMDDLLEMLQMNRRWMHEDESPAAATEAGTTDDQQPGAIEGLRATAPEEP
jgi:hypothetical protein